MRHGHAVRHLAVGIAMVSLLAFGVMRCAVAQTAADIAPNVMPLFVKGLDVVRNVQVLAGAYTPAFTTELRVAALPGPDSIVPTGVYDDLVYRSSKSAPDSFAWGLPFFLEKRVALVQKNKSASGIPIFLVLIRLGGIGVQRSLPTEPE